MADRITVKVDLGGIEEKLIALPDKVSKRLFRRALSAVGDFWVERVKSGVPVASGALRDSIDKVIKTTRNGVGTVQVGPTFDSVAQKVAENGSSSSPGVYGMFVEFGLKTKKYPKQPFMRPAFDSTAEQAIQLFADKLRDDLEEAVK